MRKNNLVSNLHEKIFAGFCSWSGKLLLRLFLRFSFKEIRSLRVEISQWEVFTGTALERSGDRAEETQEHHWGWNSTTWLKLHMTPPSSQHSDSVFGDNKLPTGLLAILIHIESHSFWLSRRERDEDRSFCPWDYNQGRNHSITLWSQECLHQSLGRRCLISFSIVLWFVCFFVLVCCFVYFLTDFRIIFQWSPCKLGFVLRLKPKTQGFWFSLECFENPLRICPYAPIARFLEGNDLSVPETASESSATCFFFHAGKILS